MIRCGIARKSRSSLEAFPIREPTQIMIMRNIQSFRRLQHYIVQLQYHKVPAKVMTHFRRAHHSKMGHDFCRHLVVLPQWHPMAVLRYAETSYIVLIALAITVAHPGDGIPL